MSDKENIIGSGIYSPLFSFNILIDTDLGLLNYVFKEFRNEKIFDLNVLDYYELINKVYYRSFQNPLYVIMKNPDSEKDKEFLDECYDEFLQTKEKEIIENSISTQIAELIQTFVKAGNIKPTIMCYTEEQYNYITSVEELQHIPAEMIDQSKEHVYAYKQFYMKYLEEAYMFPNIVNSTIYISSCGLNQTPDHKNIKITDFMINMTRNNLVQFSIIDMYLETVIGKDSYLK